MINFNSTIINSEEIQKSFFWQTTEKYLNIGQKTFRVVKIDGQEVSLKASESRPLFIFTVLKIISYLAMLLVLAVSLRKWYRRSYQFNVINPSKNIEINCARNVKKEQEDQANLSVEIKEGIAKSNQSEIALDTTEELSNPSKKSTTRRVAYKVEEMLARLQQASQEGLKLGLFVGRLASQTLPQEKGWVWCSLDCVPVVECPEDRLHLKMDINHQDDIKKIQCLFDKVVCDYSVIKFIHDPWHTMRSCLVNKPEAEIVAESWAHYKTINIVSEVEYYPRIGTMLVPAYGELAKIDHLPNLLAEIEKYLLGLFENVKLEHGFYPYREGQEAVETDYWVARNPILRPNGFN